MKRSRLSCALKAIARRVALRRGKPMNRRSEERWFKPGNLQRSGKPLPFRSDKRQAKQDIWNQFTAEKVKAGGTCIVCCKPEYDGHKLFGHHVLPLGRGGRWSLDNHALVHMPCNSYIHNNPRMAEACGWLLSSKGAA